MKGIDNTSFDQVLFTMTQPVRGSDTGQIINYIVDPLLEALLIILPLITLLFLATTCTFEWGHFHFQKTPHFSTKKVVIIGLIGLLFGVFLGGKEMGYADIKAFYFENTSIYDEHYVNPQQVNLKFPKKKRNLVFIFLESMESSYFSKELGGIQEENLLPNFADLAQNEGINFSNSNKLGGMLQIPGANQTASSMVAQTSGLPLRPSTSLNSAESSEKNSAEYFPGAYSLGEILDKQGYNQALLMGSEAEFAGRDKYFEQHGDYDIRDYQWAVDTGRLPEDYYEWWGYEDRKLVNYAKETLNELSQEEEPFNLTMLTVDTHFEDGYVTEDTPDLFGDQYSNVIHDSDRQISELLQWMEEQPFYEDTTVVLVGDHLTMDSDFFDSVDPDYQRSVFNLFLNTDKQDVRNKNRQFSAVDMFPTTLSALGVEVPGDRMGLGVNLFSDKPTLIEQLGYNQFQNELMKKSEFYNEKLMQDKEQDEESE
ncbi:MAG: LTA synthase family protein [Tetragenococcus sp.]|nr:LTA synthase family protein [Tetragenococcus sp.]